jgi:hypothetical protein
MVGQSTPPHAFVRWQLQMPFCRCSSALLKVQGLSRCSIEPEAKSLHSKPQQLSPRMVFIPKASESLPSMPTTLVAVSLVVLFASIAVAVSFLHEESEVPTYPLNSTWLQRKRQFRINGAKVIERGFVEVGLPVKIYWEIAYRNVLRLPVASFALCISMVRKERCFESA